MKLKRSVVFVCLTMAGFLASCSASKDRSDAIAQDRIYQFYSATYDQKTDQTFVTAGFQLDNKSGVALQLAGKSEVTHNTYRLGTERCCETLYSGQGSGFQSQHVFYFVDADGREYVNSASIIPVGFPSDFPTTISRHADQWLPWDGATVTEGENVAVNLSAGTLRAKFSGSTQRVGDNGIWFLKNSLSKFPLGPASVSFTREKIEKLIQGAAAGGGFATSYTTSFKTVQIVD